MEFTNDLLFAQQLDAADILKEFREDFLIPEKNGTQQIYFLGNSLGLQPKKTSAYINGVLETWATYGVEGFFKGDQPWLQFHDGLVQPLANIVGALPHEVVIMNALTVNLHLMMATFYHPDGKRNKIICEAKAFPSDQYMLETTVRQHGLDPNEIIIEVLPKDGEYTIRHEDILATIQKHKEELAVVLWGGVNYYTGQLFDMKEITKAAHAAGAIAGFDLAHAAGNTMLQLHDWDVDFACWCNYKYINSGPGAIGAAYIHERYHHDEKQQRLAGWWGYKKETRFQMRKGFDPIRSAEGWQLSTPSPILYAAHKAALDVFEKAGFDKLLQKAKALSNFLFFVVDNINKKRYGDILKIITPAKGGERGCQLSILISEHGRNVFDELSANGVFADWREPDVIRIAPVPLYNTFEEVYRFGQLLDAAITRSIS